MHYFLVIKVKHTSMRLVLTQHKYALDIIHWAGMSSCKPIDTFVSSSSKLFLASRRCIIIPHDTGRLLIPFNISLLLDQIYVMLLIRYVSLCILLPMVIGLLSNLSYVILRVQAPIICILLEVLHSLYMVILMLIGLAVLIIENPLVAT